MYIVTFRHVLRIAQSRGATYVHKNSVVQRYHRCADAEVELYATVSDSGIFRFVYTLLKGHFCSVTFYCNSSFNNIVHEYGIIKNCSLI